MAVRLVRFARFDRRSVGRRPTSSRLRLRAGPTLSHLRHCARLRDIHGEFSDDRVDSSRRLRSDATADLVEFRLAFPSGRSRNVDLDFARRNRRLDFLRRPAISRTEWTIHSPAVRRNDTFVSP